MDGILIVGALGLLAGGTLHAATQPSSTDLRPLALAVTRPVPLGQRVRERTGGWLWLVWCLLSGRRNRW